MKKVNEAQPSATERSEQGKTVGVAETELTDRELDTAVAERVMGWRTHKISEKLWYMPEAHNSIPKEQWSPSSNIADAMEVVGQSWSLSSKPKRPPILR